MRYIKPILPVLILIFAITSCKKTGVSSMKNAAIDTEVLIHEIKFNAPIQYVVTSVSGDTLKMIYYENVSLFIPPNGLNLSYALHLTQDFSGSLLKNFNYNAYDQYGDYTYDWADDNLNNVTKTITDTTINGTSMKNITVERPFIFTKVYNNAQLATAEKDSVNAVTTDKISFSSFAYFGKDYPATTTSTNILYLSLK
jgi:hypothetical protein